MGEMGPPAIKFKDYGRPHLKFWDDRTGKEGHIYYEVDY